MTRRSLWTAAAIARATHGRVSRAFQVRGLSIDTRTLEPGDLFVALGGVRDGHDFVEQAMAAGAAGVLASRPVEAPHVLVADTFLALQALALAARERAVDARRGAVTGSVGKTSVTQAVAAGLALAGRSHASIKSYNNHIGVPLTLARMPENTRFGIFEIGMNHAGEITPLTALVRPHATAITTVGPVHVENFPDGESGVARAKAEIFDGAAPGAVAVLNADNRWFGCLSARARARGLAIRSFGKTEGSDARLVDFGVDAGRGVIRAEIAVGRWISPCRRPARTGASTPCASSFSSTPWMSRVRTAWRPCPPSPPCPGAGRRARSICRAAASSPSSTRATTPTRFPWRRPSPPLAPAMPRGAGSWP